MRQRGEKPLCARAYTGMFSFSHLAIVFLIALLVFGPEKLPEVARLVGKALADFRRASTDFRRVIEDEFAEIERQNREKAEQARRKALEASTGTAVPAASATEANASPGSHGQGSRSFGTDPGSVPAAPIPGSVPHAAAQDPSTPSAAEPSPAAGTTPSDGHPA